MADNPRLSKNIPPVRRKRVRGNKFVTKSGATVKIHRTMSEKSVARREAKLARKAYRLKGLPKSRVKRILWRLNPKRVVKYWFSRDGVIMSLKIAGVGIVIGFFSLMAVFAYFRKDLPSLKDISGTNKGGSVRYYDRSGQTLLWEDYDAVKRVPVDDTQIAQTMKDATVAVEDKDFFNHGGFDTKGIIRAVYNNAKGKSTQGGSTITQQLVKLTTPGFDQDRSLTRKVKELILSVETERSYTKKEILTAYLNVAPYGGIEYGVEVGSQTYFHKSAKNLTLAESAFLASIPKSPVYYSPYSSAFDKTVLKGRSDYVLDNMFNAGKITRDQLDAAKKVDVVKEVLPRENKYTGIIAPYFVLAAKDQLESKFTETTYKRGGWKVVTTLDLGLQQQAEKLVASNLSNVTRLTRGLADEEATVLEEVPTGQIKALVGGVDFNNVEHGQNNYAASVLIPPGSSFKPYDYVTFIDNNTNIGAGTVLFDSQGALPGYPCTIKNSPKGDKNANCLWDYDFRYPGPVTLRYALGGSRNVPAVKAMLSSVPNDKSDGKVDSINKVISTASAMMANPNITGSAYNCYADEKLTVTTQCYGAAAIGDGAFLHLDDHVNGLSTMARLGTAIPKTYILQITDSSGKDTYKWKQPQGTQVIKPESAYILNNMASDPNASYLPGSCSATSCSKLSSYGYKFQRDNGWTFAVKTGTTNNGFDGLMASWSTKFAVVSWVGNHKRNINIQAYGAQMETLTEPITRGLMEAAHTGVTPVNWVQPAGVKVAAAYVLRGKISSNGEIVPSPSTDLFPSTYSKPTNFVASKQTFDKVSGKIATDCTPDLAKEVRSDSAAAQFSGDIFVTSGSSSQDKDDVHKCDDLKPGITFTVTPTATIGSYKIESSITKGTAPFNSDKFPGSVTFTIDGQVIEGGSLPISSSGDIPTIIYKSTFTGEKSFSATIVDSELYSGTASVDNVPLVKASGP